MAARRATTPFQHVAAPSHSQRSHMQTRGAQSQQGGRSGRSDAQESDRAMVADHGHVPDETNELAAHEANNGQGGEHADQHDDGPSHAKRLPLLKLPAS